MCTCMVRAQNSPTVSNWWWLFQSPLFIACCKIWCKIFEKIKTDIYVGSPKLFTIAHCLRSLLYSLCVDACVCVCVSVGCFVGKLFWLIQSQCFGVSVGVRVCAVITGCGLKYTRRTWSECEECERNWRAINPSMQQVL